MKWLSFLLILSSSVSFAQFNKETPKPNPRSSNPVILQAISYLDDDTSSIELNVFYRINPRFFFFSKKSISQQEIYIARGELIIEILDDKDATIARDFRSIQIEQTSLPNEDAPLKDELQGVFKFKLKKENHRIVAEVKDYESDKSFINKDIKVNLQGNLTNALNVSSLIFVESQKSVLNQATFSPINRGGDIVIGERSSCLFQIFTKDTSTELKLTWNIINSEKNDEELDIIKGDQHLQLFGLPTVDSDPNQISITIDKKSVYSRILIISVPIEQLEAGKYRLAITVTQGEKISEKEFSFNIIWPFEPKSLSNTKIAIEALGHIATKEELQEMNVFSYTKSKKAFREFWKKRSPDTTRAYNPALAEYYRRVDETIKRFSTENEQDGHLTDRGRIFILFGSPTMTNRLLKPNTAPKEIWTYEKLKRRFTFSDEKKNGNYTLIKTENY